MYISSAVKDINDIHLKTPNIQSIAIFFPSWVSHSLFLMLMLREMMEHRTINSIFMYTILMWDAQNILVVRKLAIESDCSPHCGDMLSLVAHSNRKEKNH